MGNIEPQQGENGKEDKRTKIERYDRRLHKGLELAYSGKVKKAGKNWAVPSQSESGSYIVTYEPNEIKCTCADFEKRKMPCKHIKAVVLIKDECVETLGKVEIIKSKRASYSQNWVAYNTAQNEEAKLFNQFLNSLVSELLYSESVLPVVKQEICITL